MQTNVVLYVYVVLRRQIFMILLASFTKSDDAAHVFNYRPCWAFHEFVTMTMNTHKQIDPLLTQNY